MSDYVKNKPSGSRSAMLFQVCSGVLFLAAIGLFIWLRTDAAEQHMTKNIFYGSSFLVITLGILLYTAFSSRAPRFWTAVLWLSTVIGIATFVVGLCLKDPAPKTVVFDDGTPAATIELEEI